MRPYFAAALAAVCLSSAHADQTAISDFRDAKDVLWNALYPTGFEEFYCGRSVSVRGGLASPFSEKP